MIITISGKRIKLSEQGLIYKFAVNIISSEIQSL